MCRYHKAQATLTVIFFVLVGMIVLFAVSRALMDVRNVQIMNVLELEIQVSDEGGRLAALLASGGPEMSRAELIGDLFLLEMPEEKGLKELLSGLYSHMVLINSTNLKDIRNVMDPPEFSTKKFYAEVPLPGAGLGGTEVKGLVRVGEGFS